MKRTRESFLGLGLASLAATPWAEKPKPLSPRGTASTQVGGKWIEVDYGRPILRGRKDIFGGGTEYGRGVNAGTPVWRAGADATTRLTTEVPLAIAGATLQPGTYAVLVELKESGWTLVLSTQKAQENHEPTEKVALWGASGYDRKLDAVRAPMTLSKAERSVDQFTISFVDMTDSGGKLSMAWDTTVAVVGFSIAH